MNTTDTTSYGVSRYVVEEVLYGTPSPPQKHVFSDDVLENLKNVTELIGKIETGKLESSTTVKLKRRSTTLQNSPKLTERIARMRCNKVEPIQEDEKNASSNSTSLSPVSNLVGKIESGAFGPSKPVTLRRISTGLKNSPKISERIARMKCNKVKPYEDVTEKSETDNGPGISLQCDLNENKETDDSKGITIQISIEPTVETTILSKSSTLETPIRKTEDFSVLFDSSNGHNNLTLHETPILRSRHKPMQLNMKMKAKGISTRSLDFDNKLKSPKSTTHQEYSDENAQARHETPILRPMQGEMKIKRQESGLTILNKIESETKLALAALKEQQLSDIESSRSSSAYSSAAESTSPESGQQIEEFTYSKLARAQLHRKFEEYYKWDVETLRPVASAVSKIRLETLSTIPNNKRVSIVKDIYQKCTENANKELYALGCALFALCDDVQLMELTSFEEYCAEKYRRRHAQRE